MAAHHSLFIMLVHSVASRDASAALRMLAEAPGLATARAVAGATREAAEAYYLEEIEHYVYAGDSALHIAAAAYQLEILKTLLGMGADVRAKNRRGAQPIHYAADGAPGGRGWNPPAQAAIIASLIGAGANPNAVDRSGVAPLHRAVRTRCAAAVKALLDGGADPQMKNLSGSTPAHLAAMNTGRGGTGLLESKIQQNEIIRLLNERTRARA